MEKHHHRITLLAIALLSSLALTAQTDRKVSAFEHHVISENQAFKLNDSTSLKTPDVYYEPQGDGTYKAHRLTVQPNGSRTVTDPALQCVTPTSVTIGWKTSTRPTTHRVMWGESKDALTNNATSRIEQLSDAYFWHTATLSGLQPDHTYYYQVRTGKTSAVYSFRTMPEAGSNDKVRALIFGDHQRNEMSDYEWLLHHAERRLAQKYGEAPLHENVNFLINVGDQVDAGKLENYELNHLYKNREYMSQLPMMTTVGNHELKSDEDVKLYESHYSSYKSLTYKGIESGTAKWYAYQTGRLLWVVLDSDHTTAEQKMWVRRIVAAADQDETVDAIISLQHRPLYAEMYCNDVSNWMREEMVPILSSSPKHVLNCAGHHHLYARGQMTDYPLYHIISGGGVGTTATGYEQMFGVCLVDNKDCEEVQKTVDQYTYQILEYDPATKTVRVESYAIGNRRLALDGELVDTFTRCLADDAVPATPVMACKDQMLVQQDAEEELHSAHYQIARDEAFTDVVESRVRTFEDWYWVEDDFRPKDQNKGVPVTQIDLAGQTTLQSGTYYARVRNRNMNLGWSAWSTPIQFAYSQQADQPNISLDGTYYKPGQTVTVSVTNADKLGKDAWVGIYAEGKKPGGGDNSYAWSYVSGASRLTFNLADANGYFAVLFKDGGYTEVTERIHFMVLPEREKPFSLSLDKQAYQKGDPVVVTLTGAPCLAKDWVGIYAETQVPADSKCPTYLYMGST
ncbi:MAG: metallophosphoesterase family protein, partial [Bacteroidaceae bacterium]|nr:metallophosphoesterase family protein [Bacteroidaceae bacterium]